MWGDFLRVGVEQQAVMGCRYVEVSVTRPTQLVTPGFGQVGRLNQIQTGFVRLPIHQVVAPDIYSRERPEDRSTLIPHGSVSCGRSPLHNSSPGLSRPNRMSRSSFASSSCDAAATIRSRGSRSAEWAFGTAAEYRTSPDSRSIRATPPPDEVSSICDPLLTDLHSSREFKLDFR
jgi:hypothetical protein